MENIPVTMEHNNTLIDHNMKKGLSKIFMMNNLKYINYQYKAENKYQYIYTLLILLLAYNHL